MNINCAYMWPSFKGICFMKLTAFLKTGVICVIMPYSSERALCFRGTYELSLLPCFAGVYSSPNLPPRRCSCYVPLVCWTFSELHCITSQKIIVFIITTVKNLKSMLLYSSLLSHLSAHLCLHTKCKVELGWHSQYNDWLWAAQQRDRSSSPGRVKNFLFSAASIPAQRLLFA
jgi:hypothetical protein